MASSRNLLFRSTLQQKRGHRGRAIFGTYSTITRQNREHQSRKYINPK